MDGWKAQAISSGILSEYAYQARAKDSELFSFMDFDFLELFKVPNEVHSEGFLLFCHGFC